MGIKGLNQLLNQTCSLSHISLVPICNFAGKKVAVDATLYACVFKNRQCFVDSFKQRQCNQSISSNLKQSFTDSVVEMLTLLRENLIQPIFVFDGIAPDEKQGERRERQEKREATRRKIQKLEQDLEVFEKTGDMSDELKRVDSKVRKLAILKINVKKIRDHIDKMKLQVSPITKEEFNSMKEILDAFGVQHIVAVSEAEFTCAAMARHGIVDAVITRDTDAIACLAPMTIVNIEGSFFRIIYIEKILNKMNMSTESFQDLCILCGTDFNKNIPGIGPRKSLDLINLYKSIDNIPPDKLDTTCLNVKRVREIFSFCDTKPNIEIFKMKKPDFEKIAKFYPNINMIKSRFNPKQIKLVA